jgi:hypothetical protein
MAFSDRYADAFDTEVVLPLISSQDSSSSMHSDMSAETLVYWFPRVVEPPAPPAQVRQDGEVVFSIFIKCPSSSTRALSVVPSTSMKEVAERYADMRQWWGAVLAVGMNGIAFPSAACLADYNITKDDTMDVCVVLNGGAGSHGESAAPAAGADDDVSMTSPTTSSNDGQEHLRGTQWFAHIKNL